MMRPTPREKIYRDAHRSLIKKHKKFHIWHEKEGTQVQYNGEKNENIDVGLKSHIR